jgi:hypothetical protein
MPTLFGGSHLNPNPQIWHWEPSTLPTLIFTFKHINWYWYQISLKTLHTSLVPVLWSNVRGRHLSGMRLVSNCFWKFHIRHPVLILNLATSFQMEYNILKIKIKCHITQSIFMKMQPYFCLYQNVCFFVWENFQIM